MKTRLFYFFENTQVFCPTHFFWPQHHSSHIMKIVFFLSLLIQTIILVFFSVPNTWSWTGNTILLVFFLVNRIVQSVLFFLQAFSSTNQTSEPGQRSQMFTIVSTVFLQSTALSVFILTNEHNKTDLIQDHIFFFGRLYHCLVLSSFPGMMLSLCSLLRKITTSSQNHSEFFASSCVFPNNIRSFAQTASFTGYTEESAASSHSSDTDCVTLPPPSHSTDNPNDSPKTLTITMLIGITAVTFKTIWMLASLPQWWDSNATCQHSSMHHDGTSLESWVSCGLETLNNIDNMIIVHTLVIVLYFLHRSHHENRVPPIFISTSLFYCLWQLIFLAASPILYPDTFSTILMSFHDSLAQFVIFLFFYPITSMFFYLLLEELLLTSHCLSFHRRKYRIRVEYLLCNHTTIMKESHAWILAFFSCSSILIAGEILNGEESDLLGVILECFQGLVMLFIISYTVYLMFKHSNRTAQQQEIQPRDTLLLLPACGTIIATVCMLEKDPKSLTSWARNGNQIVQLLFTVVQTIFIVGFHSIVSITFHLLMGCSHLLLLVFAILSEAHHKIQTGEDFPSSSPHHLLQLELVQAFMWMVIEFHVACSRFHLDTYLGLLELRKNQHKEQDHSNQFTPVFSPFLPSTPCYQSTITSFLLQPEYDK